MTLTRTTSEAFIAAQMEIRHGRATIETCGYKPRTHGEQQSLEACEAGAKKRKRRANAMVETIEAKSNPELTLRQLVTKACDHPSGGIPIGIRGFPPANSMVKRAIRKGYATLTRTPGLGGRCNYTRLIPTEKGQSFAARS